jgi:hypothetical protein
MRKIYTTVRARVFLLDLEEGSTREDRTEEESQAIADAIDASITARAKEVLAVGVTLEEVLNVAIVNEDGSGELYRAHFT